MTSISLTRRWQGEEHSWLKQHSLGVTLAVLMAIQTAYAVWAGSYVFSREQPLGEGIPTFGREFWAWWSWEYNISLVADTFGVLLIVMLSKWLYEQGSAEQGNGNGQQEAEEQNGSDEGEARQQTHDAATELTPPLSR